MKRALLLAAALTGCSASLDPASLSCRNDGECPTGSYCTGAGKCAEAPACDAGKTLCHDACVDLQTSTANCGACGNACTAPANGSALCQSGGCAVACAPPAVKQGASCLLPPATPGPLTATSTTTVSLNWAAQAGAASYQVLRAGAQAGPYVLIASPSVTSYVDDTVAAGATYFYEVVAVNAAGASAPTAPVQALTQPARPGNLAAALDGSKAGVGLTWDRVPGAAGYDVYRGQAAGAEAFYLSVDDPGSGTQVTVSDPQPTTGLTDFYEVLARNASGSSGLSTEVSALTVPAPPAAVAATPQADGTVQIVWGTSTGATGYAVFRDGAQVSAGLPPTQFAYVDTPPSGGVSYGYAVAASNASGLGAQSAPKAALLRPDAPGHALATLDAGKTSITVSWDRMTGATSYDLYRGTAAGAETLLQNVADPGSGTSAAYGDAAPDRGLTDFYYVVARNASGASPISAPETSALTVPLSPSGVGATANSDGTVTVAWTAPAGATSFAVARDGSVVAPSLGAAAVSYQDSPPAGGTYAYAVTAANGSGPGPAATSNATTHPAATTISLASASAASGNTTFNLSWTRPTGATSYDLYRDGVFLVSVTDPGGGAPSAGTADVENTRAATHTFKVFARNSGGSSATSNTLSLVTEPADPTGLVTSNIGTASVTLTWNRSTGATAYNVLRGAPGAEAFLAAVADPGSGTTVQYVDNAAQPSTAYGYKVAATNNGAQVVSGNSGEATATTQTPVPTGLTAAQRDDTHMTLTWNRVTAGVDSYDVLRGTTAGGEAATPVGNQLDPGSGAQVQFIDSGLSANTAYFYKIVGRKGALSSAGSAEASARSMLPAPTGLVLTKVGDSGLTLTWNKPAGGPYSYNIARGLVTSQEFEFTQFPDDPLSSTTQSVDDGGLVPGTAYFYKVRAVNNAGNTSVLSGEATATTSFVNGPALTVATVDGTHFTLGVTRLTGYDYYEFYRSQSNTPPTAPTSSPAAVTRHDGTGFVITDVVTSSPNPYYYAVRARFTSTGTPSPWSPLVSSFTFSGTPVTPANLSVLAAGNNQVLLQWDPSTGASGYNVLRGTTASGPFTTVASPAVPYYADIGSTGADPKSGNTYFYEVQAFNGVFNSAVTAAVPATVDPSAFAALERSTFYSDSATVNIPNVVGGKVLSLSGASSPFRCLDDGHCLALGVPAGPVFVKRGLHHILTSLRTIDLSSDGYGRVDAQPYNSTTPISFTLTNMSQWTASDFFELTAGNIGLNLNAGSASAFGQGTLAHAPAIGDTQLTQYTVDGLEWGQAIDTAKGDTPRLHQISPFTSSGGVPYLTISRIYQGFAMSQSDGRPLAIAPGAFTTVTPTAHPFKYLRSQFKAMAPQINPTAVPTGVADAVFFQATPYDVNGLAHPFGTAGAAAPADLFFFTLDTGSGDVNAGTINIGNPLPSNAGSGGWYAFADVECGFAMSVNCSACGPGGTPLSPFPTGGGVSSIDNLATVLNEAATTGITPHMTPVGSPKITPTGGGAALPLFQDNTGVGLTPTISWTAPTGVVSPNYYRLFIYTIGDDGSGSGVANQLGLSQVYTTGTSVQIPQGILTACTTPPCPSYFIDIRPTYEPARDILNVPFHRGDREYFVDSITNSFTP